MRIASTIAEIKKIIVVNANFKPTLLEPGELDAQEYIIQILGRDEFDALQTAYTANTLSANQQKLLPYVQQAMVCLAMLLSGDELQLEISNTGFQINVSTERKTAFQWQIIAIKKRYKARAFKALQNLLVFLHKSTSTDFPLWYASDERKDFLQYFINDANAFSRGYNIQNNFSFFLFLRETMNDVEYKYIQPILGKALFDEIKTQILGNTISNANKEILKLIYPAVAWKTIHHAIPKLIGYTDEFGIQEDFISTTIDVKNATEFGNDIISLKIRTTDNEGETYLNRLNDYLIANATTYPLFVAPTESEVTVNKQERGFYAVL